MQFPVKNSAEETGRREDGAEGWGGVGGGGRREGVFSKGMLAFFSKEQST